MFDLAARLATDVIVGLDDGGGGGLELQAKHIATSELLKLHEQRPSLAQHGWWISCSHRHSPRPVPDQSPTQSPTQSPMEIYSFSKKFVNKKEFC